MSFLYLSIEKQNIHYYIYPWSYNCVCDETAAAENKTMQIPCTKLYDVTVSGWICDLAELISTASSV